MPAVQKLDLHKLHAAEYAARRYPTLIETKPGRYLTIEGRGDPDGPEFGEKAGALYAMAYTIKMGKKRMGRDFKVAALEGLWWATGAKGTAMLARPREAWRWKLLIRMPSFVTHRCLGLAAKALLEKGSGKTVAAVRLETIDEARCVQMLHMGSYASEPATIAAMEAFAAKEGVRFAGLHHEIYLSNPRRVKPEKLRTILRHPVR